MSRPDASVSLNSITYRSRAVAAMSEHDLLRLAAAAQKRNASEGVTGLLLYDRGEFFQWLEGPEDGVSRVWDSVRRDRRHTDVELVASKQASRRVFGSSLKLLRRDSDLARGDLRTRPSDFAEHLASATLPELLEKVVIPAVIGRHRSKRPVPPPDPRAADLAHLLLAIDPSAADALVHELYASSGELAALAASLFEPAARGLGDLWSSDDCSAIELTIALCRLQTTLRGLDAPHAAIAGMPAVLVAPQPGELHLLGAALDSALLWQSGWDAHLEYPKTDAALTTLVAETWFDALDLSLSTALLREETLPHMAQTIEAARSASLNPALVVLVGGRSFVSPASRAFDVGADAVGSTAMHATTLLMQALRRPRLARRRHVPLTG